LDHALLWSHGESCDRRVSPLTRHGAGQSLSFPSWSWAGWMGSIQYLLVEKGEGTFQRESHEYARSEIPLFQVLHHGTLYELFKSSESINASETRHLGMVQGQCIDEVFPVYMVYAETKTTPFLWARPRVKRSTLLDVCGQCRSVHVHREGRSTQTCRSRACQRPGNTRVDTDARSQQGPLRVVFLSARDDKLVQESDWRAVWSHRVDPDLEFWRCAEQAGGSQDRGWPGPPFDERKLPYKGEGSGLVNAMLIQWNEEVAERITVAQIHRQAWEAASPERKHIRLG
jgi:uncharacterized CHY-type Zn-finger protein